MKKPLSNCLDSGF